jgi:hypothetical protein
MSKLSLVHWARASRASKTFRAASRSKAAMEHQARCELATKRFGLQLITLIIVLVERVLKGESLEAYLEPDMEGISYNAWEWVSVDGAWITEKLVPRPPNRWIENYVDTMVNVWLSGRPTRRDMDIIVDPRDGGRVHIYISQGVHNKTTIEVYPSAGDDVSGVALLHTLLSQGLSQTLHGAGQHVSIEVCGWIKSSRRACRDMIAPLMPFIAVEGPTLTTGILNGVL